VVGTADHPTAGSVENELTADDIRAIFSNRDLRYGENWTLALQSLAHDIDLDGRLGVGSGPPPAPTEDVPVVEGGLSEQWTHNLGNMRRPHAAEQNPNRNLFASEGILEALIFTIARSNKYGETRRGLRENALAIAQFTIATLGKAERIDAQGRELSGFSVSARNRVVERLLAAEPPAPNAVPRPLWSPTPAETLSLSDIDLANAALDILSWKDANGQTHDLDGKSYVGSPGSPLSNDLGSVLLELASLRSTFGTLSEPGSQADAIGCKAYNNLLRMGAHGIFNVQIFSVLVTNLPGDYFGSSSWGKAHYRAALAALTAIGLANETEAQDFANRLRSWAGDTLYNKSDVDGPASRAAVIEAMQALSAHGGPNDAAADAFYRALVVRFQALRAIPKDGTAAGPGQKDYLARWDAMQAVAGGARAAAPAEACAIAQGGRAFLVMRPRRPDGKGPYGDAQAAVDFANQKIGTESHAHKLWLGNAGDGALLVQKIKFINPRTAFRVDDRDCTARPIEPLSHCEISVFFKPVDDDYTDALTRVVTNGGTQLVSMEGTGTYRSLYPASVERSQNHVAFRYYRSDKKYGACENTKLVGWYAILANRAPMTLEGQVVENHVASDDFAGVHFAQDYNFFVYPDESYRKLMAMPGNFDEGDPYELGRIEVEWERRNVEGKNRIAAGFPQWAWPAQGDRVRVDGTWIYDCGHHSSGPNGYRSEIHPPRFAVTYRNNALAETGDAVGRLGSYHQGSDGLTWATRADIFGSSFGGDAIWSEEGSTLLTHGTDKWWQAVNDRDYLFEVLAPPKPSPDAQLTYWECDHLKAGDCATQGLPNTDTPVVGAAQPSVEVTALPSSSAIPGYKVWVRFGAVPVPASRLLVVGKTIWVGWKNIDPKVADAIGPHLLNYTVTFNHVNILENLALVGSADWTMWAYANENAGALFSGDGETLIGEPLKSVKSGNSFETKDLSNNVMVGTLVDDQPLRLKILAAKYNRITNGEAGTADIRLFDNALQSGSRSLSPDKVIGDHTLYGFPIDHDCPRTGCFDAAVDLAISKPH
jgi:hypothetical protein